MEQDTNKLIADQLKTLPPNLQKAINTVPWKGAVLDIAKNFDLTPEQTASLEQETMFVIYGFESPDDYLANVMRELGISEDDTLEIVESIAEDVFDVITNEARKAAGDKGGANDFVFIGPEDKNPNPQATTSSWKDLIKKAPPEIKPDLTEKAGMPEISPETHPFISQAPKDIHPVRVQGSPDIHPTVVPGEKAHAVKEGTVISRPPETNQASTDRGQVRTWKTDSEPGKKGPSVPDYRYEKGGDPYREPLK